MKYNKNETYIEKNLTRFFTQTFDVKLQQEVLKFNICLIWSSQETDLETNFLNLENRKYDNASFSQKEICISVTI